MTRDDTELVLRAASGDGDAFGRLVDEHAGWLLRRVARRLARRPDAEDLVQEILLAAYLQLPELRDPERFGAWLPTRLFGQKPRGDTKRPRKTIHEAGGRAELWCSHANRT